MRMQVGDLKKKYTRETRGGVRTVNCRGTTGENIAGVGVTWGIARDPTRKKGERLPEKK